MQRSREKKKVFSGTFCPLLFQLASFLCLQKDWKQSIGKLGVLLKRRSGGFSQGLPFLSSYWKHSSNIWVGASLETLTGNSHSIHIFSLIGWLIRKSTICMPANFPPPMLCPPPREQFPFLQNKWWIRAVSQPCWTIWYFQLHFSSPASSLFNPAPETSKHKNTRTFIWFSLLQTTRSQLFHRTPIAMIWEQPW